MIDNERTRSNKRESGQGRGDRKSEEGGEDGYGYEVTDGYTLDRTENIKNKQKGNKKQGINANGFNHNIDTYHDSDNM